MSPKRSMAPPRPSPLPRRPDRPAPCPRRSGSRRRRRGRRSSTSSASSSGVLLILASTDRPASPGTSDRQYRTNNVDVVQRDGPEVSAVPTPSGLGGEQPRFARRRDGATPRGVRQPAVLGVAGSGSALGGSHAVYGHAVRVE